MESTPGRLLRIHLSTTVLMMFTAGGFVWLNLTPHEDRVMFYLGKSHQDLVRGWPFYCHVTVKGSGFEYGTFHLSQGFIDSFDILPGASFGWDCWWLGPLSNGMVALGAIVSVAAISEAITRRKFPWQGLHTSTRWVISILAWVLAVAQVYGQHHELNMGANEVMVVIERGWPGTFHADKGLFEGFRPSMLAIDAAVCIAVLVLAACLAECIARRK